MFELHLTKKDDNQTTLMVITMPFIPRVGDIISIPDLSDLMVQVDSVQHYCHESKEYWHTTLWITQIN